MRNSELGAGLVIGVAGAGVLLEVAVIAVRFLNIGLLSLKIDTFLIVVCHCSFIGYTAPTVVQTT